jgi:hypothetical protein
MALADPWAARWEVGASRRLGGNNKSKHHFSCSSSGRWSHNIVARQCYFGQHNCVLPVLTVNRLPATAQTALGA